ncbi:MAG: hypothetical protein PHS19_03220 [Eubacteriales bacterium]|nr:hypothetical protein [Eubacteriales bacterium]
MKRLVPLVTVSLLILVLAIAWVSFGVKEFAGSQVFNNALETSGVDVRIEAEGGGFTEPGRIVSYTPTITNLYSDSFIRVSFDSDPEEVFGMGDDWVKRGNYYYCKLPLAKGESRDLFDRIRIPESLGSGDLDYRLTARVDAIQARNFAPDFNSISPWGTIIIQEANSSAIRNQRALEAKRIIRPDFNYVKPGTFECSTSDLFCGFDNFQPGETCSEMLNMRNNSGGKMIVYFRTDNHKTDLLEEMKLKISCGGESVYEGNLSSEELNSFIRIADIENGQAGGLEFQIGMPESADNRYAMLRDNVTWIIAVKEQEEAEQDREEVEQNPGDKDAVSGSPADDSVGTGEQTLPLALMAAIAGTSLLVIMIILLRETRRNKKDD